MGGVIDGYKATVFSRVRRFDGHLFIDCVNQELERPLFASGGVKRRTILVSLLGSIRILFRHPEARYHRKG